jgi:hypothetical protein
MDRQPNIRQLIWGAALAAAGVGVFIMLPQRMAQIAEARQIDPASFEMLFLWFCFGLLGVLLIGGGTRKIYRCLKTPPSDDPQ